MPEGEVLPGAGATGGTLEPAPGAPLPWVAGYSVRGIEVEGGVTGESLLRCICEYSPRSSVPLPSRSAALNDCEVVAASVGDSRPSPFTSRPSKGCRISVGKGGFASLTAPGVVGCASAAPVISTAPHTTKVFMTSTPSMDMNLFIRSPLYWQRRERLFECGINLTRRPPNAYLNRRHGCRPKAVLRKTELHI